MGREESLWLAAGAAVVSAGAVYAVRKYRESRSVLVTLPPWLLAYEKSLEGKEFKTDEEMMVVAVEISSKNVEHGTGGPFGCAIFAKDEKNGKATLFSVGCNRVTTLHNSTLHGETVAIAYAEKKLQTFTLKSESNVKYVMCTSCEPCAMCIGATFWAGPAEMICAATKDDAESIGFNEGPVFPQSYKMLEESGVKVKKSVLREQGRQVLLRYGESGLIYNSSGK